MATTDSTSTAPAGLTLTDPALFREACYIDGAWVGARSGATIPVDDPATGAVIGTVPRLGGDRNSRGHRRRRARVSRLAQRRPRRNARRFCAAGSSL